MKRLAAIPLLGLAVAALLTNGCHESPTAPPVAQPLSGRWVGGPLNLCYGDWSSVVLELQQQGTHLSGQLTTHDQQVFPADGSIENDAGSIGITIFGSCPSVTFAIAGVDRGAGNATRFFGELSGRCCNTVFQQYAFARVGD